MRDNDVWKSNDTTVGTVIFSDKINKKKEI